jgi:hypothetical protein
MTEDQDDFTETTDTVARAEVEDLGLAPEAAVLASSVGPGPLDEPAPARSFVYALGRIEPRFPTLSIEKEFAQVAGRDGAIGLTDQQALNLLLRERSNRYLVRELCWVFTIEGLETYILHPRDPADFDLLVEAVRPLSRPTDVDVVVGVLGPIAPPEACNALMVPIVGFDQLYSFDVDSLVKSIPRPRGMKAERFEPIAEELFMRIAQIADNAGSADEDRALNYLSVRYPLIYHAAAEHIAAGSTLTSVEVRPSRLSGARSIVDVVFAYTDRTTDVTEKEFVRVDVTEEFPFLVTKLSPYFERDS